MNSNFNINLNPLSWIDGIFDISGKRQEKRDIAAFERNAALSREFAQNSMQWKAQDLRKAGINPIYAMGAGGYSAPVSGVTARSAPLGDGLSISSSYVVEKATANKLNAEANKTNAEARSIEAATHNRDTNKTDYQFLAGVDGKIRTYQSEEASEALENDWIGRLGWHGRNSLPYLGSAYEERRNNLYNSLIVAGKLNPLTEDIIMDAFGGFEIVKRSHPSAKKQMKNKQFSDSMSKPFSWYKN